MGADGFGGEGRGPACRPAAGQTNPDHALLAALMRRIAAQDRAAFEQLYRATSAKLFGICLRIVPERRDAEEVLQDVFTTAWRRADRFDEARGHALGWLVTIARNRAVDRLRATRGIGGAPMDLAERLADPRPLAAETMEADDEARRLHACLGEIDAGDARLIRAAFMEGSTYAELATRAALPLGTVKSRIRRALLKLRTCLA